MIKCPQLNVEGGRPGIFRIQQAAAPTATSEKGRKNKKLEVGRLIHVSSSSEGATVMALV